MVRTGEGVVQRNSWCQSCPESLRCFLVGRTIDVQEAMHKSYPCVEDRRFIFFYYHQACCITFDCHLKRVNDWGYWGYSITTSRSIRWYLEALWIEGFIDSRTTVEAAIDFFKQRRKGVGSNDHTLEWFQC